MQPFKKRPKLAVLTLFSIFLFLTHSEGEVPIVNVLGIISLIGIVGSFIMGIISLGQMAKTPPQKANSKFLAIWATVLSGLCIVSLLLVLVL